MEDNTTLEPPVPTVTPAPVALADPPFPQAEVDAPIPAARRDWWARWAATGLLGLVGGYVVFSSDFAYQLGMTFLPVPQSPPIVATSTMALLFGFSAVTAAFLLAPGPIARRIVGAVVFVIVSGFALFLLIARMAPAGVIVPAWFSVGALPVLAGAIGWLLASGARPAAWFSLIAPLLLFLPINFWLTMARANGDVVTFVFDALALTVGLVVLGASAIGRRA